LSVFITFFFALKAKLEVPDYVGEFFQIKLRLVHTDHTLKRKALFSMRFNVWSVK